MPISNANLVFILLLSGSTLRAQINVSSSDICVCDGAPQQPFSVSAEGSAGPFFSFGQGLMVTLLPLKNHLILQHLDLMS
ncbi:MAG: hypothetical protein KI786_02315 [Mameliella sp.]|nr:hypothetical protein [Phaeodactylibacter sp.]